MTNIMYYVLCIMYYLKWKEDCAYEHKKSDSNIKIEILKSQVRKLTNEIKQLNNNMSEIMMKMITLEESKILMTMCSQKKVNQTVNI